MAMSVNSKDDIDAIAQCLSNWRYNINTSKDVEKIVEAYTDDCILMPPNAPICHGKEAVREKMQELIDSGLVFFHTKHVSIETCGNMGSDVTLYRAETIEGKVVETGRTVCVWKKMDGVWHIHRDIYGPDSAPSNAY
ncbi:unnamed protein product [Owenia fusiformis]|uniref:Uncharacterized protein n=1 Tax=Owenia fusiformis TaxID=6347 RepID=A0A8J1TZ87_OWEFU|nr:unnamed protein product [Owenia fusiformis]